MANTVLQIKRSGTTTSIPSALEYGELAINYADGALFYKNVNDSIVDIIPNPSYFGTVNVDGSLIVASIGDDVLRILPGTNITLAANTSNGSLSISSTGGGGSVTVANTPPGSPTEGDLWWSSNVGSGQLYIYYNDGANSQWVLSSPPWSQTANLVSDLSPQLGADLDLNGFNIDFPSTSNVDDVLDEDDLSSNSATGLATQQSIKTYVDQNAQFIRQFQTGEVCNVGDVCYYKSDGKMWQTDADAEASSGGLLAICTEDLASGANGTFLLRGYYTTSGLTTASTYYLSTSPGAWTTTQPSGNTDIVRIIGYALDATTLYFDPDKSYVEVSA